MTDYALYVESGPRMKTTMIHVLDLLGCVANGPTTEAALGVTADEIWEYLRFLRRYGEEVDTEALPPDFDVSKPPTFPPPSPDTGEVRLALRELGRLNWHVAQHVMEGSWIGYGDPAPGFAPDLEPLTREELAMHLRRLRWLGEDIAMTAEMLTPEQLSAKPAKGRSLHAIFCHIAAAEPEYARTAGAGKTAGVKELIEMIQGSPGATAHALQRLFDLVIKQFEAIPDEDLHKVTQRGEKAYTARRGLRRALEHPWEHFREIQRRIE